MAEGVARRLRRLEQSVDKIAPGKRQLFFMKVPRDKYDQAKAILNALAQSAKVPSPEQPPEPTEVQLELTELVAAHQRAGQQKPAKTSGSIRDESSDRARLKYLRDLSNDRDYRNSW